MRRNIVETPLSAMVVAAEGAIKLIRSPSSPPPLRCRARFRPALSATVYKTPCYWPHFTPGKMNFYFEAAKILDKLDQKQGSIKGVLSSVPEKDRKRTSALVIESLKCTFTLVATRLLC